MMEKILFRIVMTALLCALVLVSTGAMAQQADIVTPPIYVVERGTTSGEGYRLDSLAWSASCAVKGGGYRLQGPVRPLQGAGCCCTFVPLIFTSYP
jgi:hypothetical protein